MATLGQFISQIPTAPHRLALLPDDATRSLLFLAALLGRIRRWSGPDFHQWLNAWLQEAAGRSHSESNLLEWLRSRLAGCTLRPAAVESARCEAEALHRAGRWVAVWLSAPPPAEGSVPCPHVLFGDGVLSSERPWITLFNSRKPKALARYAGWLEGLRALASALPKSRATLAGSLGTLTYDLSAVIAMRGNRPLQLVLPTPIEAWPRLSLLARDLPQPHRLLSCLTSALSCPKPIRMLCRDRILAHLADVHLLLELRPEGHLVRILARQQSHAPRPQLQLAHREAPFQPAGARSAQTSAPFSLTQPASADWRKSCPGGQCPPCKDFPAETDRRIRPSSTRAIRWEDYLYHYTRSCPGPWPGEDYRDYLEALLDAASLCEHTALDTLIHLLEEGRIRGSQKLVRGQMAVVSWSAVPPPALASIRQWSPGLLRWTFEPCGIAVRRGALRTRGAKPTIYAPDAACNRLRPAERFRFQRHEPPRCRWKHEREWRLAGDLALEGLAGSDGFVFVETAAEAMRLKQAVMVSLPVIALGEMIAHGIQEAADRPEDR